MFSFLKYCLSFGRYSSFCEKTGHVISALFQLIFFGKGSCNFSGEVAQSIVLLPIVVFVRVRSGSDYRWVSYLEHFSGSKGRQIIKYRISLGILAQCTSNMALVIYINKVFLGLSLIHI